MPTSSRFPDVQYSLRPGMIELKAGHPDLNLLPAEGLLQAAQHVLRETPAQALSYGAEQGPGRLLELFCDWLLNSESVEQRQAAVSPLSMDRIFITGGSSQALDMLCHLLTQPGDIALVQSPTYHLALRILHEDHGLELLAVPGDDEGLNIDALEHLVTILQQQGRPPRLLYLVPTFGNPDSSTLTLERRQALVALAQRLNFLIVEDDVYTHLWYDTPPPPSLYSLAPAGTVIRLGSFSKILAPGLRLGWMCAAPELIQRCVTSGVLDSGGGLNHFSAHIVAAFIEMGLLDRQIATLREAYRLRRDRLVNALEEFLPATCRWAIPQGGFFLWLQLPVGIDSREFLPIAETAGVSYLPGNIFFTNGDGKEYCRLNFTMFGADDLSEGAQRLGDALAHFRELR